MQTIVDYGGHVLDVAVDHPLYGQIRADLIINNRLDVEEFVERMVSYKAQPLKVLSRRLSIIQSLQNLKKTWILLSRSCVKRDI